MSSDTGKGGVMDASPATVAGDAYRNYREMRSTAIQQYQKIADAEMLHKSMMARNVQYRELNRTLRMCLEILHLRGVTAPASISAVLGEAKAILDSNMSVDAREMNEQRMRLRAAALGERSLTPSASGATSSAESAAVALGRAQARMPEMEDTDETKSVF